MMPMHVAVMEKQTFEQALEAPEYTGQTIECWMGEVREKMPTNPYTSAIATRLSFYLTAYLMANPIGHVTGADGGYRMSDEFWFVPDVGYISRERQPQFPRKGYNPLPPDLAVEVISPTDLYADVQQKAALYLQYGTRMVWVVDPASQTVMVYQAERTQRLSLADTLDGEDVLPGFSVAVKDLFPN